ncbi:MAG: dihydrofolate reductase family protein [Cyanobacteriota bacterium]|nr:dihydrofolate reductase family protein [Cyanobacteriota bacterium]
MLRLVLAVSLDGRLAPAAGGAAQFGGAGDRRALEEALAWADGALLGAETLRRHGSTCLIHAPDLLAERHRRGLPPQPPALVVSRRGCFPSTLPFWQQPLERWLVTPGASAPDTPAVAIEGPAPLGFSRRLPLQAWPQLLALLAAEGMQRLVLLGGAALAGGLLSDGLVDELQLTLCPLLLGGPHTWLPAMPLLPDSLTATGGWELLEQRPLGAGELLLRYRRCRAM